MQPSTEPDVLGLLTETRMALAYLRADELEALALRAEVMLAGCGNLCLAPMKQKSRDSVARQRDERARVQREHRMLSDLLAATGDNLRVLRRVRGDREGNSRWGL